MKPVMHSLKQSRKPQRLVFPLCLSTALLAGGCTAMPGQPAPGDDDSTHPQVHKDSETVQAATIRTPRPDIELTEDILYRLLVAEIAGQRGQLDIAVSNYLELARQTRDPEIASRATRIAVYARDDAASSEAATIWAELEPDNTDAHQVLAVMAVRDGDLDQAMEHFQYILRNAGEVIDQKLWVIANLLSKEEDQQVAKQVMERLMEGHQEDPDALYAYAHVMSRLNDDEKSLQILEKVLTLTPENANAAISYVSLLQKMGRTPEAIDWLEKSLHSNDEDNFNLRLYYARLLTDQKRFDEARRQFELLVSEAPNNIDVLYALGLLYLQNNRLDEAQIYFERLSSLGEQTSEANYYLGRIAEEKGELEKAANWYQSLQQGGNYFDAQVRLALLYARQDSVDTARNHLRGIRTDSQEQKNILVQAEGELLTEEKRYQDAMAVYDAALTVSSDPDLLYARAMLAEKMNRLDILERDLRTILEDDPEHAQALNALGYTLADKTDRYQEAYGYIKKALELKPNDFYILDSMGWVLYRMGRLEEAIEYLNRALKQRRDPEIAAHLGEVLWVKGDRAEAKKIWESALQETPDDSYLLDVIRRFNP